MNGFQRVPWNQEKHEKGRWKKRIQKLISKGMERTHTPGFCAISEVTAPSVASPSLLDGMCTEWPGVLRGAIAPLGRGGNGADGGAV